MAAKENDSDQQLDLDWDVYSHPPTLAVFLKGLCLMLPTNMMKRLTQAEELLADDKDALAEEEQETDAIFKRLDITSSKF